MIEKDNPPTPNRGKLESFENKLRNQKRGIAKNRQK